MADRALACTAAPCLTYTHLPTINPQLCSTCTPTTRTPRPAARGWAASAAARCLCRCRGWQRAAAAFLRQSWSCSGQWHADLVVLAALPFCAGRPACCTKACSLQPAHHPCASLISWCPMAPLPLQGVHPPGCTSSSTLPLPRRIMLLTSSKLVPMSLQGVHAPGVRKVCRQLLDHAHASPARGPDARQRCV